MDADEPQTTDAKTIYSANLTILADQGKVEAGDKTIRLGPVNMRLLVLFTKNQGQVISRETIFNTVWKNQQVSDETLTRSISDLRAQLGKISTEPKLIETFPKRGYKWLPPVSTSPKKSQKQRSNKTGLVKSIFIVLIGLLFLSTAFLWTANHLTVSDKIKIVLMPLKASANNQELALNIEELLQVNITRQNNIGFLSSAVLKGLNGENFSYLSSKYDVGWIIEGEIRNSNNLDIITLTLVDARTALVAFSVNSKIELNYINMKIICRDFIKSVAQHIEI